MSEDIKDISQYLEKTTIDKDDIIDIGQEDVPPASSSAIQNLKTTKKYESILEKCVQKALIDFPFLIVNSNEGLDESLGGQKQKAPVPPLEETINSTRQFQADMPTFDFHRFLEQMKEPSAAHIARYTKGFIAAFHRREAWTVNEQIKFIQDFLNFTNVKMRDCDVWRDISDKEFENAKEGMEKLVMNRLFNATFSPSTMDDKEKDEILHHKINIFRWVREEHIDIPKTDDNDSFLTFAESELLKMNNYKAPRDKLICILNCCKVIFGLMKHMEGDEGADVFLPLLIYVVIRANPPKLISNVQYISRFRNPDHLQSEAGYYLTNLANFDDNIERTMAELDQEQPQVIDDAKKQVVSYENAMHPIYAKKQQQKEQPLIDLGTDIAQKSIHFVEKLLSDSSASNSENETSTSTKQMLRRRHNHQHNPDTHFPDDPSSLSQKLPVPANMETSNLAAARVEGTTARDSHKEFDENLSTIVSMFPNIEPGVCFMILQASEGKLPQTIERYIKDGKQRRLKPVLNLRPL
ncbi:hypothetical protein [Parasitella parasitica]|uniref:VPS9 domain-containing protein n=1 Tax=Parasitella parasitica TaxID=35722 RepID=A0A0B7MWN1_9FUNG|nr:hypothetical protein [Parasitella parasitica]